MEGNDREMEGNGSDHKNEEQNHTMSNKRDCPAKDWTFTHHNYTDNDEEKIQGLYPDTASYLIYGRERGETGETPHLQGYLRLVKKDRLTGIKRKLDVGDEIHLDKKYKKSTPAQAAEYCKKDGDFVEFGECPSNNGARTDLADVVDAIKNGASMRQIAQEHTEQFIKYGRGIRDTALLLVEPYTHTGVRGLWFYGAPGLGKSRTVSAKWPDAYRKEKNSWFDGYNGEETIIVDDYDKTDQWITNKLKIWADSYSHIAETKGGSVHLRHHRFVVTSNYGISELLRKNPLIDDVTVEAVERRFKQYHLIKVFSTNDDPVTEGEWRTEIRNPQGVTVAELDSNGNITRDLGLNAELDMI